MGSTPTYVSPDCLRFRLEEMRVRVMFVVVSIINLSQSVLWEAVI
jgi:hypothetical protein